MSERAKRIEECARALLDGSEGIKLNAGTAEVMNYWNRYRGLRAALRAALSLPPDAPDEYLRGYEDGVVATIKEYDLAPPPAPGACERCGEEWAWESVCTNPKCPACHGEGAEP